METVQQLWETLEIEEPPLQPRWLHLAADADKIGTKFELEFEELAKGDRRLSLSALRARMGNLDAVRSVVAQLHTEAKSLRLYVQHALQQSPQHLLPLVGAGALAATGTGIPLAVFLLQAEAWLLATVLSVENDKKHARDHDSQDQEMQALADAVASLERSRRLSNIRERTRAEPNQPAIDFD